MTQPDRIEKLLVLLTIAFCWAHKTGEWQHVQKAIKIK
ncbi:IS4 family transposase, partial [Legionella pneumophila]